MFEVAIADDHPLMREGITKVLQNEIDIEVTNKSSNAYEILSFLETSVPDIAVLDISMPGKSGLDLIKDIQHRYPDLPLLILSIHPAERFAVRALKAGASGYLCKSSISKELVRAIRKILNQKRQYIPDEVAEQLVMQVQNGDEGLPLHESLSNREFQILCMIASGNSVTSIARKLSVSPHTVHTYRSRIKKKTNLDSDVEMTHYAIENGLID